jgi:metallo-beta-lactamase class B
MRFLSLASALLALSCTGDGTERPPLASDAVFAAAEQAPLDPFAVNGEWNVPFPPFTAIGNIHYVGTKGVSAWLITSPKGHVLIDGILPQSVPQIAANIRTLGFDIRDVRYLLNSHAHFDHAGGLAGLQRLSGATMVASAKDKPYLEAGDIGMPPSGGMKFPPIRVDRVVGEGDTVRTGGTVLTAHLTPGHSPGCTSWSMPVTGADGARHRVLFHCSATVAGQSLVPESWPGMVGDFRTTFARFKTIKTDVLLANHENFFDLPAKRARQIAGDANAFVVPGELQRFNAELEAAFSEELARQQAAKK